MRSNATPIYHEDQFYPSLDTVNGSTTVAIGRLGCEGRPIQFDCDRSCFTVIPVTHHEATQGFRACHSAWLESQGVSVARGRRGNRSNNGKFRQIANINIHKCLHPFGKLDIWVQRCFNKHQVDLSH